jgi:SET domain-containing protein
MPSEDEFFIDAKNKGGVARFINHSCEPNVYAFTKQSSDGHYHIGIYAKINISPMTELFLDYAWTKDAGSTTTECHCGAKACRGTIERVTNILVARKKIRVA